MADSGPNVTQVVFNEIIFSFHYKGIFFGLHSTWFANSRYTLKAEWMAETQEDRTADVKTLYKEPFSKQRNISLARHLVFLFPFSSLCHKVSPPSHLQILAATAAT